MLDGEKKPDQAIEAFRKAREIAPSDSYLEADSHYEIARLNLKAWLDSPGPGNAPQLERSIAEYDAWLQRSWTKIMTKMWGHYHQACALKERLKFDDGGDRAALQRRFDSHTLQFKTEADSLVGYRKYSLRFVAFLTMSPTVDYLPGEPLRCGLDDLLSPYLVR